MITDELASLAKISIKEAEGKPDKILEKLEYNQLKMKEKLNRHYDLLKWLFLYIYEIQMKFLIYFMAIFDNLRC